LNVNEYGVPFVFSTGYDMSADTAIRINFTKPDGTVLSVADPLVTVPTIDLQTTDGLFLAHQYVSYTFQNGDVDQVGIWSARVYYTDLTRGLISDAAEFEVFP